MLKYLIVLIVFVLVGCSSLSGTEKTVTKYGEFSYYLAGTKKPTVVFESGLADNMKVWQQVIEGLEQDVQVFAYNRAGFSGSDSFNTVRSGLNIVSELNTLLAINKLPPPYILVGHSLGGGYMELYAKTYPDQVSGVVLVDPNSSKYPERCKRAKLDFCDPPSSMPAWAELFFPKAVSGEIRAFSTTHAQINAVNDFPEVPLVVISAPEIKADMNSGEKAAAELYLTMQKELSEHSPNSIHVICNDCSHNLHQENPEIVIEGIDWIITNSSKVKEQQRQ